MREYYKTYHKVGRIEFPINELLGLKNFKRTVYASPGVVKHIKKRHSKQLNSKMKNSILDMIKTIIKYPDYIGINYNQNIATSIEFIKKIDNNTIMLLALSADFDEKYIYVATMYPITRSKLKSRIYRDRVMKLEELQEVVL